MGHVKKVEATSCGPNPEIPPRLTCPEGLTPPGISSSSTSGNPSPLLPPSHCELPQRNRGASALPTGQVPVDGRKEKRRHILINEEQQLKVVKPNNGNQTEISPALVAITLPEISGPTSVSRQTASETSFADAVCP